MRLRLTLEYDGTGFRGWAAQPGLRTVEGELGRALGELYSGWQRLAVAGRTDTGVHARGQVASVEVDGGPPANRAAAALNAVLQDDMAVTAVEPAADDFHARHDARSRTYRYRVFRRDTPSPFEARRSLWWPHPLDEDALREAAGAVVGEHDFRAFTPTETQHKTLTRVVEAAAWEQDSDHLDFVVTANSFLRHMVRTLVGTMLERSPEDVAPVLAGRSRANAGRTAPPWALYLERVTY